MEDGHRPSISARGHDPFAGLEGDAMTKKRARSRSTPRPDASEPHLDNWGASTGAVGGIAASNEPIVLFNTWGRMAAKRQDGNSQAFRLVMSMHGGRPTMTKGAAAELLRAAP